MILNEAIENAEKKAEEIRNEAEHYEIAGVNIYGCEERAQEWEQFAEWLKELKQLREQAEWIPVSERLPEEDNQYLICFNDGELDLDYYCRGFLNYSGVIAWMPLPKPYKAESDES